MILSTNDSAGFVTKRRSVRGGEQKTVEKPKIVVNYKALMGNVDRVIVCLKKFLKCWRKIFSFSVWACGP